MPGIRLIMILLLLTAVQLVFWRWNPSYEYFLTLSGYLSINFMSLTLWLATRPAWLETAVGGLDRTYRLHKWTGILATVFALSHWLIEMGDDLFKAMFGKDRALRETDFSGVLDSLQDGAEDLGEPGLYLLLFLVVISLWRRVPYHFWRYLHRAMPLIYLALAAHALLLAPAGWWQVPTGWMMALLMAAGGTGALVSLGGRIGRHRRYQGVLKQVQPRADNVTEITCDLGDQWPGHDAGQFALVTFDRREGAHPFTLSAANSGQGELRFQIKPLGDYTRSLAGRLTPGQHIWVEGPYGRFNPERGRKKAQQFWVAGGIGITPFLAALDERLNADLNTNRTPVSLHYCTRSAGTDPMVARLQQLAARLPEVSLNIHDSQKGQRLASDDLPVEQPVLDLWFCGPSALARILRLELKRKKLSLRFHQELFEFR